MIPIILVGLPGLDRDRAAQDLGPAASVLAVNQPPVAVANASPTTVEVGGLVYFDASASTDDDYIANYTWNWTVDSQNIYFYWIWPVWAVNRTGNFTVTLTVMDSWGLSSSDTVRINVTAPQWPYPPTAEAGPNQTVQSHESTRFTGDRCWGTIIDYIWTFDVGGAPVRLWGRWPQYTFDEVGSYVVKLTVVGWDGLTDEDTLTVRVLDLPWPGVAEAGPNQTVNVGEIVSFSGSGSRFYSEITNYTWSFYDGTPCWLWGMNATYTFRTPGDYVVTLSVYGYDFLDFEDDLVVHVLAIPNRPPHAEAGPNTTIESGTSYRFDGSKSTDDSPGLSYVWNFRYNGTQEVLLGIRVIFPFVTPGRYTVTLTVGDAGGLSDSDTVIITVTEKVGVTGFIENYGVWLAIGGAEAALVALAALVVMKRRSSSKN